jgi:site-specific DNA-cytosine methylase
VNAIELNGCSGGMAEGFRRAGITFTWCFDWDPDACASYERNLGHRPVRMDIGDLVRMARGGWSPGEVDLLVADPPCTPWSRAGKRQGTADERDMLEETCELIALLRPRCFLIGNVPGLQDSTSWHVVQRVIGGLGRHGYCVADYQQLDAADYGVPQRRIRPFWFGHLAGPCLVWPAPTHAAPSPTLALGGLGLKPWVTCRQALAHLPPEEMGRPVRLRWKPTDDHRPSAVDEPAKALTTNTHSDGSLRGASRHSTVRVSRKHPPVGQDGPSTTIRSGGEGHAPPATVLVNGRHPPIEPDAPASTVAAKQRGQGAQVLRTSAVLDGRGEVPQSQRLISPDEPATAVQAREDRIGRGSPTMAWPWDRPATTICRDDRIPPPGHHDGGSYMSAKDWPWERPSTVVCAGIDKIAPADEHAGQFGPNAIVLSERAAAILQGFPGGWVFVGKTKRARWSQIGQAMPPALAEAVARSIVRQMQAAGEELDREYRRTLDAAAADRLLDEECA